MPISEANVGIRGLGQSSGPVVPVPKIEASEATVIYGANTSVLHKRQPSVAPAAAVAEVMAAPQAEIADEPVDESKLIKKARTKFKAERKPESDSE